MLKQSHSISNKHKSEAIADELYVTPQGVFWENDYNTT